MNKTFVVGFVGSVRDVLSTEGRDTRGVPTDGRTPVPVGAWTEWWEDLSRKELLPLYDPPAPSPGSLRRPTRRSRTELYGKSFGLVKGTRNPWLTLIWVFPGYIRILWS